MDKSIISIRSVNKFFSSGSFFSSKEASKVTAIDNMSLDISKGEIMGLIGESGSGKTTLVRALLGLTRVNQGEIFVGGKDIANCSKAELKEIRSKIAVVFQDPASNLNPRLTVEKSLMRPLMINGVAKDEAERRIDDAFEKVKMDKHYLSSYSHQLSGGQQQRIAIARALILKPEIMILDEPTSALDISVQAQILNLLIDLQESLGLTYMIVTHDLNVIRYISDRVAVMYMGRLMEYGNTEDVMMKPIHPYTKLLLDSVPAISPEEKNTKKESLISEQREFEKERKGCLLAGCCQNASDKCRVEVPPITGYKNNQHAACFHGLSV